MASLHSGDSNFEITFINYRGAEYVIKSGDENQGVLLGFTISESLFDSNVITGDIKLLDSAALDERVPFVGQEKIRIKFYNELMDKTNYEGTFTIVKRSATMTDGPRSFYVLDFCSDEFIANLRNRVSKSYKGVIASDIIEDVYEQYILSDQFVQNKKPLYFDVRGNSDATFFPMHFVFPTVRPFQAIDMVVKKSAASSLRSAGSEVANFGRFLFYENKNGFYYKALSDLLEPRITDTPAEIEESEIQNQEQQGLDYGQPSQQSREKGKRIKSGAVTTSTEVPVATYVIRPADSFDSTDDSNETSVIQYTLLSAFNVLNNLVEGMYSGRLLTYDTVTKRIGTVFPKTSSKVEGETIALSQNLNKIRKYTQKTDYYEYDYYNQFSNFRHVDNHPLTNNYHYGRGRSESFYKYQTTNLEHNEKMITQVYQNIMTDNDKSATSVDKQVERWLLQRYSQNRQTRNIAMSLTIPGDHNRTIGEIVGIKLPSNYYPKEEHTFYTGNYLITEVIHNVTGGGLFTTQMKLVKDSLFSELERVNEDLLNPEEVIESFSGDGFTAARTDAR